MSMNEEEVQNVITTELKRIDKGEDYDGPWDVNYIISKEYAPGMPWESEEDKKGWSQAISHSKPAYLFTVSKVDANRVEKLLRTAKSVRQSVE